MDHPTPRILIVEDDQRLAELTAEYLQANGYEVSVEGDGARA
ncbi:DNA-binding response regulator, partial [Klebsiella pneumoniae]|nr:DNA-binding response regulator [Klebsiella pneumoniae]